MADRYSAEIYIGGKIHEDAVKDLVGAIHSDGAYCGPGGSEKEVPEDLRIEQLLTSKYINERGHLFLYDYEASCGELEAVEQFCRDAGLSYDRYSGGAYDVIPEKMMYRPEFGHASHLTTDERHPLVSAISVQEAYDWLLRGNYTRALNVLAECAVPNWPLPILERL